MFVGGGSGSPSFDFDRWDVHRSSSRYYRLVSGALVGITTRRILPAVLLLMVFSSAVCVYGQLAINLQALPELQLPLTPFELTAPALGLLLVFRSDNAYARFKDGRELSWEITTGIRSANRRLLAWTGAPTTPAAEREAAEELVLSCCLLHDWIMNEHLRESEVQLRASDRSGCGRKTSARLTSRLTYEAVLCAALGLETADGLESSGLEPTPYLGLEAISLGSTQRLPSLTDQERIGIDDCLKEVTTNLGKCESLLRTPIPLGYTRYSVRFLWVWLCLLPFALARTFSDFEVGTWWEGRIDEPWPILVASVTFIASIFLSIEDIAVQIEEPFAILPLEFHHKWLLRDVAQSRRLMAWSRQKLVEGSLSQQALSGTARMGGFEGTNSNLGAERLKQQLALRSLEEPPVIRPAGGAALEERGV